MNKRYKVKFLRVFTDRERNFGDMASIVIDEGRKLSDEKRQAITKELNTGETIFINSIIHTNISVMHAQGEIDFAGVGVLAAGWFLTKLLGKPISVIHGRSTQIKFWQEGEISWTQANLTILPEWHLKRVISPESVNTIQLPDTKDLAHTMVWAWIDEDNGIIRARTFANDWDIPETEGNGSGAMLLASILNRSIEIKHGKGSLIFAKPVDDNSAAIGGRIVEVIVQQV